MSEIRVETSDLRTGSSSLDGAGNEIGSVQAQVSGLPGQAGNAYDGQLRRALEAIIGGDIRAAAQLATRAYDSRDELLRRATGFESANEAGRIAMISVSQQFDAFLQRSSIFRALSAIFGADAAKAIFLWGAGGLGIGGLVKWISFLWSPTGQPQPSPAPIPRPTPYISEFQSPTSKSVNDPSNQYYHYGDTYKGGPYKGDRHPGIDIPAKKGEPVHPIGEGKVIKVDDDENGYGHYVVVEHELEDGRRLYTLYAHLDEDSTGSLTEESIVHKDSVIGKVGNTGNWGDSYHLHLEVRTDDGYDAESKTGKSYADAQRDDWDKYWLDPQKVINSSDYTYRYQ